MRMEDSGRGRQPWPDLRGDFNWEDPAWGADGAYTRRILICGIEQHARSRAVVAQIDRGWMSRSCCISGAGCWISAGLMRACAGVSSPRRRTDMVVHAPSQHKLSADTVEARRGGTEAGRRTRDSPAGFFTDRAIVRAGAT